MGQQTARPALWRPAQNLKILKVLEERGHHRNAQGRNTRAEHTPINKRTAQFIIPDFLGNRLHVCSPICCNGPNAGRSKGRCSSIAAQKGRVWEIVMEIRLVAMLVGPD